MPLTRDALITHLRTNARLDPNGVADDTPLFSSGKVDSFAMVDLIVFIESQTGRPMPPGDVDLANLDTIGRILAYASKAA